MAKWEYCYVLQYPDNTGVLYFQEGDSEQAQKSSEQNIQSGRQVIDELGRNGWETVSVSTVRDGIAATDDIRKKPAYRWVLKRRDATSEYQPKIGTD
jgi:hypothetical protein